MLSPKKQNQGLTGLPRPLGVTILGTLSFIGGAISILAGLAIMTSGTLFANVLSTLSTSAPLLAGLAGLFGAAEIILGVFSLAIGYGFLKGLRWSWWLAIISYVLGIILSIPSLLVVIGIVPIIVYSLIIYYLTRPEAKSWFKV